MIADPRVVCFPKKGKGEKFRGSVVSLRFLTKEQGRGREMVARRRGTKSFFQRAFILKPEV